jgi:hypothetical protein
MRKILRGKYALAYADPELTMVIAPPDGVAVFDRYSQAAVWMAENKGKPCLIELPKPKKRSTRVGRWASRRWERRRAWSA